MIGTNGFNILDHWWPKLPKGSFDSVPKVTRQGITGMFANCCSFNMSLEGWDVSAVTSMQSMFTSRPRARIVMEGSVFA